MTPNQYRSLNLRWSVLFTAIVAIFWGSFFLIKGYVPAIYSFEFFGFPIPVHPYIASRWLDILATPPWTLLFIYAVKSYAETVRPEDNTISRFSVIMGLAFTFSAIVTMLYGLEVMAIGAWLAMIAHASTMQKESEVLRTESESELFYSVTLPAALGAGMIYGLLIGLIVWLLLIITMAIVGGASILPRHIRQWPLQGSPKVYLVKKWLAGL